VPRTPRARRRARVIGFALVPKPVGRVVVFLELVTTDRIIGGFDEASRRVSSAVHRSFITGKLLEIDATTAELVKLMENTFREVNIALGNELRSSPSGSASMRGRRSGLPTTIRA
jgi:UDP-N-acetyl-D-mannosaminuronate dehydrogenase